MRTSRFFKTLPLAIAVAGMAALMAASSGAGAKGKDVDHGTDRGLSQAPGSAYTDGRLVVRFAAGVSPGQAKKSLDSLGATITKERGRSKLVTIGLPEGADLEAAIAALEASGVVDLVGYDYIASAFDGPNDPGYGGQWHLHDTTGGMWAEAAWGLAPSAGGGVTVAVIDTGVAFETNDSSILWFPQHFEPAPDLAGVTIVAPWNFINENTHANDDHGHGTHVAGTVLQATNNGQGVAGVAHGANLMPLKILDYSGNGTAADLIESIYYAVDNGADVINMSLGFAGTGEPDAYGEVCSEIPGLDGALDYAFENGVTVVAAAGNEGATQVACPAAYHSVISVGALRYDGASTFYSNSGWALDISAPGGDPNVDQDGNGSNDGVLQQSFCLDPGSLLFSGDYTDFCSVHMSGTSMASPHVAGVAALLLGENASLTPLQVRYFLETTARDRGPAGRDDSYGWGALDAFAALTALQSGPPPVITPTPPPAPPPGNGPAGPTALTATGTSSSAIALTWQDNASNETGYKVERRIPGGNFTQVTTLAANATSWTSTGLAAGTTYDFRVRASGSAADSYFSNLASAATFGPPSAPTGLTATTLGPDSVRLTWTDTATYEQGFRIDRSTDGVNWTITGAVLANVTTYTPTSLAPATTYQFRVRAYEGANNSAWSNIASATTQPPPAAPSGTTATATGATSIAVSWVDNATTETAYRVERSSDGVAFTMVAQLGANVTSYNNLYLPANTTYHYRVRAVEGNVTSGPSNVATATTLAPPAAPTGLTASGASYTSIRLDWVDNATGEAGYRVERSVDGSSWSQVAQVGANSTTWTNLYLAAGSSYWYRVRAYEGSLNGAYSAAAFGTTLPPPAAPTNVSATTLSTSSVRVNWTDTTSTESGFRIERSTDGVSWAQAGTVGANVTAYTNTLLTPGTTYQYRVRAYEGTVNGTPSAVVSATTFPPPAAPTNLTATRVNATTVRLDWNDNATNESGFRVERSTNGVNWVQFASVGPNVTTWTNLYVTTGTTYYYRVRAYEGTSVYSAYTAVVSITP